MPSSLAPRFGSGFATAAGNLHTRRALVLYAVCDPPPISISDDDDALACAFLKACEGARDQAAFDLLWYDLPVGARLIVKEVAARLAKARRLMRFLAESIDA